MLANRRGVQDFGEARARGGGGPFGQRNARKKTGFRDFPVGRALAEHREIADHIDRHMVAVRRVRVEKKAV